MNEENELDFNFWPSFADLMLSLVLILVLVMSAIMVPMVGERANIRKAVESQKKLVQEISTAYKVIPVEKTFDSSLVRYEISISSAGNPDIIVENYLDRQTIKFNDNILFEPDQVNISPRGREVMSLVGGQLFNNISQIQRIQIEGHADTDKTVQHGSNLRLGALRAIAVFEFLRGSVGIDPAKHLMSVTSFGEWKPVQRNDNDMDFNQDQLMAANQLAEEKGRNRRVELLLIYRK